MAEIIVVRDSKKLRRFRPAMHGSGWVAFIDGARARDFDTVLCSMPGGDAVS
jgi:hypothetical protein